MKKRLYLIITLLLFTYIISDAQKEILYKQIDSTKLYLEIYQPEKLDTSTKHPAMIFFFGGGWKVGKRAAFLQHAKYFSQRGLVCFLADYRIESRHKTTPFESLKDAKSAIRLKQILFCNR